MYLDAGASGLGKLTTTMARVLLRARLVSHGGLKLVLDLNVRYLVPVTKDVGSIATEQVDVFFAVKVPHFAPFCPRVKLTRVFFLINLVSCKYNLSGHYIKEQLGFKSVKNTEAEFHFHNVFSPEDSLMVTHELPVKKEW